MDTLLDMIQTGTAPQIPGLVFRYYRDLEDIPHMWAAIEGCKHVDGWERSDTVEDMIRTYTHLHNCDPTQDALLAEIDGQVVGYTRVDWDINGEGQWSGMKFCCVLPEWRRRGIGSALLRFNEARLCQIAAALKQRGEVPAEMPTVYVSFVGGAEKDCADLLLENGYHTERFFAEMVRPDLENIPDLPMPQGLEIRPVSAEQMRVVWEASNEAFRDHWGYVPDPWEDWVAWSEGPTFDPSLWRVAWDGDQIAGMVLSFIDAAQNKEYGRLRGYTENICVRRPWRKRGLAHALIADSLRALKARGMQEAALGVDAENLSGALQLYEQMGFRTIKHNTFFKKAF